MSILKVEWICAKVLPTFFLVTLLAPLTALAQIDILREKIEKILAASDATVGVGIMDLKTKDTITINGKRQFPMQSVYKFPLAMAVLHQIDQGKFSLDQKIHLTKKDLLPNTWSPLSKKYPEGNVDIPLSEILSLTVSLSDNNGCDILFRLLGGTRVVNAYIHDLGVEGIAIVATEEEMHLDWNTQFKNWCTPHAMLQLLDIFYQGKALSKSSNDFLWKAMTETTTGPRRIKGLLPIGTMVAHKTGTSGPNKEGLVAAVNDVGIVELPNGKQFAIVVYVSNSMKDEKTLELIIAELSKNSWDYFAKG